MKQFGIDGKCMDHTWELEQQRRAEKAAKKPAIFFARYKRYAAWPVVIWCRIMRHRKQPTWGQSPRCLRCGDKR